MSEWMLAKPVGYIDTKLPEYEWFREAYDYTFVSQIEPDIQWCSSTKDALTFNAYHTASEACERLKTLLGNDLRVRSQAQHPKPEFSAYWKVGKWPSTTKVLQDTLVLGDHAATVEVLRSRAVAGVGAVVDVGDDTFSKSPVENQADDGFGAAYMASRGKRYAAHLERIAAIGRGEITDDPELVAKLREQLAHFQRQDDLRDRVKSGEFTLDQVDEINCAQRLARAK